MTHTVTRPRPRRPSRRRRRRLSAYQRFAELEDRALRALGWCDPCLGLVRDYVLRSTFGPCPCPACEGNWFKPVAIVAVAEAYAPLLVT